MDDFYNISDNLHPRSMRSISLSVLIGCLFFACLADSNCFFDQFECTNGEGCVPGWKFCHKDENRICSDSSDQIMYDQTLHSSEDGIPCRNFEFLKRICFLPKNQIHKKLMICRQDDKCADDEFKCRNGEKCVLRKHFCDGHSDCSDDSDEIWFPSLKYRVHNLADGILCGNDDHLDKICLLDKKEAHKQSTLCRKEASCPENTFRCNNGLLCLEPLWFCSGVQDCSDGSDEITYNPSLHTKDDGLPCRNIFWSKGLCLLPKNQSHQANAICSECPSDHFECVNGEKCLQHRYFCDSRPDCSDGSDEISFNSSIHSPKDGTSCRNWKKLGNICLLPVEQGQKKNRICKRDLACSRGQFKCADNEKCIKGKWFCDSNRNCRDGSDEVLYNSSLHTAEDGKPCRHKRLLNRICLLPNNQIHKSSTLCKKDSDCRNDEFKCENGEKCIKRGRFCNSFQDCSDGSDEIPYQPSIHTSDDGIPCRHIVRRRKQCLLPKEQMHKEQKLCGKPQV